MGAGRLLAANSTDLFWDVDGSTTNAGTRIVRCSIAGCAGTPTTVAWTGGLINYSAGVISADDSGVYWSNSLSSTIGSGIWACAGGSCGGSPKLLAPSPSGTIRNIVVHGGTIYWAQESSAYPAWAGDGSLRSCPITGCEGVQTQLGATGCAGSGTPCTGTSGIMDITSDGNTVVWSTNGTQRVLACPAAGCGTNQPTELAGQASGAAGAELTIVGPDVYWVSQAGFAAIQQAPPTNSIFRCAKTGCSGTPSPVAAGLGLGGIATDGTHLWYVERGTYFPVQLNWDPSKVMRVPITGGPPAAIATLPGGTGALAGVTNNGAYYFAGVKPPPFPGYTIVEVSASGGVNTLATRPSMPEWLTLDGGALYWAEASSAVWKLPLGGSPTFFATAQFKSGPALPNRRLAAKGGFVYLEETNGLKRLSSSNPSDCTVLLRTGGSSTITVDTLGAIRSAPRAGPDPGDFSILVRTAK